NRQNDIRASIIVPAFNCEKFIGATLHSIISQCARDDEVIVVDDGSTDKTAEIIGAFQTDDVCIRYHRIGNSGGPARPRSVGIRMARGAWILLFDSDDVMLNGKINETLSAALAYPAAKMIFTICRAVDEKNVVLTSRFLDGYTTTSSRTLAGDQRPILIKAKDAYAGMTSENFVGTSGVAIRRDVFEEIGYFDESLKNGDDRDMWFRIMRQNDVLYIPGEYHCYRIRSDSISNKVSDTKIIARIKVLERQLSYPHSPKITRNLRHLIAENYKCLAWLCLS